MSSSLSAARPWLGHAMERTMIIGMHAVIYTRDAEADRAFFRDVLSLPSVDAGDGWLIFALRAGLPSRRE
jgi:hypothetical protein